MLLPRKADDLLIDWGGSSCPYLPATDGNDCPLHLAILVARAVNWAKPGVRISERSSAVLDERLPHSNRRAEPLFSVVPYRAPLGPKLTLL